MILAGSIKVGGVRADKQAMMVAVDAVIDLDRPVSAYVSRGGDKLAPALDAFEVEVEGRVALDVGASTGGFTDCLLQRGAARVYAVDVGYGQMAWRLRQDSRVVLIERQNIRYLPPDLIPETLNLAVIDVSFISLTLVLPPVVRLLAPGAWVVALVKPQFEVGKGQVGRGGIVRDNQQRREVVEKIVTFSRECGLKPIGMLESPVAGQKGNREVLVGWRWGDAEPVGV
ncbi:TlyA family rRNA (cytidine-2'-O)-methyltransferase [Nitrospira sp.]|nr:TlyA family rRNA (cytidine-2'-O)-methyltransferase [Nitrospira sp.]